MSKKFKLEISLGNSSMKTKRDVSRALQIISGKVHLNSEGEVMDENGNAVGTWKFVNES